MGHDFVVSTRWLQRLKRHKIVPGPSAEKRRETNIGQLQEKYCPKDLFNVHETALFYRMLPQNTLALKGKHCRPVSRARPV
ncbi:hypothetical protein HPB48_011744 [Haemaphysalis longicornis]|uniref:HTH CENPB-type domain-containing protein n=1 Tax=Haemaphysalis longicornis TaxID=44386 RepID=A0A9J6H3V4_HAELO|nr:hypothetical protein HPB48_011744 [Haemaphysalis longicornis]